MREYRNDFDEAKYLTFLTKNEKLLERYNDLWNKVSNTIKKRFDRELAYNEKYLRIK